ncbi:GNAT family N-acetyltransferase [Luteimonas sp. SJ-16]|uniref:GNAT family N-acetyltransferase n=2 Tax=Luteimonas deserti TaxID=2752306 RepID=A0A7Z0U152_9GAMM|nr:GNAT family N-acetyltransferase [Luteimonas deserti]
MMRAFYDEEGLVFDAVRIAGAARALLDAPDTGTVLLLGDAADLGYLVLTRGFSLEQGGGFALLDELFIAPHARCRGLGAAALEIAKRHVRTWGVRTLRLEVHRRNPRARVLYLRSGFHDDQRDLLTLVDDAAGDAGRHPARP